jgi:hypothetical protein
MLRDTTSRAYEYPALCIPRALGQITEEDLHTIISQAGLGVISKIVLKPKEFTLPVWEQTKSLATANDNNNHTDHHRQTVCYNNIYIYFKQWNTADPRVCKYRENIIKGQSIKIVHNAIPNPIFWRCVAANFTTPKQIK